MASDSPLYVAPSEHPFSVLDRKKGVICPHCGHTAMINLGKGKNKKVELSLLVHPQWLAGEAKQDAKRGASWANHHPRAQRRYRRAVARQHTLDLLAASQVLAMIMSASGRWSVPGANRLSQTVPEFAATRSAAPSATMMSMAEPISDATRVAGACIVTVRPAPSRTVIGCAKVGTASSIAAMSERFCVSVTEDMSRG
jgi:hypothetical protein